MYVSAMSSDDGTTASFLFPFQINMKAEKEKKKKRKKSIVFKKKCVYIIEHFSLLPKTYVCLLTLTYSMKHSNDVIVRDLNKM